jgi:D-glycerate 3-kinase
MQSNRLQHLLTRLALPEEYASFVSLYLEPVAAMLDTRIRQGGAPLIGINGTQGSGKSTAALFLKFLLESLYSHRIAVLSIDDFYHSKASRNELSRTVHPLFATRGVPGTHDIDLALKTIEALKHATDGQYVEVPRFDKEHDERRPQTQWEHLQGPFSAIILEGWCIGAPPLDEADLDKPMNALERLEDTEGVWRKTYAHFLAGEYQQLFGSIDWLLMLKAPSFAMVYEWRLLQEQKLAQSVEHASELLDEKQLMHFIQHYQRLTEHCLRRIPGIADAVIELDKLHRMTGLKVKQS